MFFLKKKNIKIPVEVSGRHCHLSKNDLEELFGKGYELKKIKELSQPSDFACEETVQMQVGNKIFEKVRIVGPTREQTQAEISLTDAIGSGVNPPLRISGDLKDSAGFILKGPVGSIELAEGLIIAQRHIHCATDEAKKMGFKNGDVVSVRINGERGLVFENVKIRVKQDYKLSMQIDTDEGNSAGINKISKGEIV
jgi:putative phosphotransacetylase